MSADETPTKLSSETLHFTASNTLLASEATYILLVHLAQREINNKKTTFVICLSAIHHYKSFCRSKKYSFSKVKSVNPINCGRVTGHPWCNWLISESLFMGGGSAGYSQSAIRVSGIFFSHFHFLIFSFLLLLSHFTFDINFFLPCFYVYLLIVVGVFLGWIDMDIFQPSERDLVGTAWQVGWES